MIDIIALWYRWSYVEFLALDHVGRVMRAAPLSVIAACAAVAMLRRRHR